MSKVNLGIYNIQLDDISVEALTELLIFAGNTAALFANTEMSKGRAGNNVVNLARLANDANDLLLYLKETTKMGEPISEEKH